MVRIVLKGFRMTLSILLVITCVCLFSFAFTVATTSSSCGGGCSIRTESPIFGLLCCSFLCYILAGVDPVGINVHCGREVIDPSLESLSADFAV
jgi:hypothetical protein